MKQLFWNSEVDTDAFIAARADNLRWASENTESTESTEKCLYKLSSWV